MKLLQRIRQGEIELCCVGEHGEQIWVNIYDVINYLEDEIIKRGDQKETLENLGKAIKKLEDDNEKYREALLEIDSSDTLTFKQRMLLEDPLPFIYKTVKEVLKETE